jgi:hypothetical protein
VTVRTPHVALFDLLFEFREGYGSIGHRADVVDLRASNVVELENDRIGNAAITARMQAEKVTDESTIDFSLGLSSRIDLRSEDLSIVAVVLGIG